MAKNTDIDVTEEIKTETKKEKTVQKSVRKYAPTDRIPCRSLTYGELLLTGPKTRLLHTWANYGDVTEMEFQDLQALKSTRSSYLFKPRFIIEDEELIEQWSGDFKKMYDEIVEMDVEALFRLPIGQLKSKLKKAPAGVQLAVKNMAGEKIMNGTLDSLAKIKAIDEVLDTQLMLYVK
jgi:hypothetical protein